MADFIYFNQFCNQIKSCLNIFIATFAENFPLEIVVEISAVSYFSVCVPIKDKALSARAAFGSETRRRFVTFLYQIYRTGRRRLSHCHIKYYLCSLAHKRDRLTRLDPSFACVCVHEERTFDITAPHIKHEGRVVGSQSKNNIDPLFRPANKYRKYRAELSAPIFFLAAR